MVNSNKKHSSGLISNAFGVAKKLSETGLNVLQHVAPGTVSKLTQSPQADSVGPWAGLIAAFGRPRG